MKSRAKPHSQSGTEFEYLYNRKGPLRCSLYCMLCVILNKALSMLRFPVAHRIPLLLGLVFFFHFFFWSCFVEFDSCFKLYHR